MIHDLSGVTDDRVEQLKTDEAELYVTSLSNYRMLFRPSFDARQVKTAFRNALIPLCRVINLQIAGKSGCQISFHQSKRRAHFQARLTIGDSGCNAFTVVRMICLVTDIAG